MRADRDAERGRGFFVRQKANGAIDVDVELRLRIVHQRHPFLEPHVRPGCADDGPRAPVDRLRHLPVIEIERVAFREVQAVLAALGTEPKAILAAVMGGKRKHPPRRQEPTAKSVRNGSLSTKQTPFLAIGAAFCFTIMMFNIPVPGGTTVHPIGATLLAILLGPWAAVIGVTVALAIQALFFADGGVLALGANSFSMAFAMPFCGYFAYRLAAIQVRTNS